MKKSKPKILILSGYGLNCEEETAFAFQKAGGETRIVHINDLIEKPKTLDDYVILVVPGGFSYGDDTGSGKAYANKLKNHLGNALTDFAKRDTLILGICNGFQILTQFGLLPGSLVFNDSARYIDRWVDLKVVGKSPWFVGIDSISLPIAHGEGKYIISEKDSKQFHKENGIGAVYTEGPISDFQKLPYNPNGAMEDIAAVLSPNGRILGMMPHPERALSITQYPNWYSTKEDALRKGKPLPVDGEGLQLFKNAINYFSNK